MKMQSGAGESGRWAILAERLEGLVASALLLLAALGLTGCSTVEAPPQHVVLVNHSGRSLYLAGPKARKTESPQDFERHLAAITNAIAASRTLLACERLLRVGGVAPRIADNGPELSCNASETSFSPMLWVTCA